MALVFAATQQNSVFILCADGEGVGTDANAIESKNVIGDAEIETEENTAEENRKVGQWKRRDDGGIEIVHTRPTKVKTIRSALYTRKLWIGH